MEFFEQMIIDAPPGKQGEAMEIMKRAADDGWRLAGPCCQTIIIMRRALPAVMDGSGR